MRSAALCFKEFAQRLHLDTLLSLFQFRTPEILSQCAACRGALRKGRRMSDRRKEDRVMSLRPNSPVRKANGALGFCFIWRTPVCLSRDSIFRSTNPVLDMRMPSAVQWCHDVSRPCLRPCLGRPKLAVVTTTTVDMDVILALWPIFLLESSAATDRGTSCFAEVGFPKIRGTSWGPL